MRRPSWVGTLLLLCTALPPLSAQTLVNPGFDQAYPPVAPTADTAPDAAALLLTPPLSGGAGAGQLRFLEEYFAAGGGQSADVLAYHGYVYPAEGEIPSLARFRALAATAGLGSKPVRDTETGTDLAGASEADTGAYVSRALILGWALGCRWTYFYAYDGSFTGFDAPTTDPKKRDPAHLENSGTAYVRTMGWLNGAKMLSCTSDAQGV